MAKTLTRSVDLESIDRLEEKMKQLVGVIERLRGEQAQLVEANGQLTRELETLQSRVSEAEGSSAELITLREEREVIRGRVAEMLQQIEALDL
jgi:regulator of replication initiation timing